MTDSAEVRWWHAFGKWTHEIESIDPDTGETGPSWMSMLVGPTRVTPEEAKLDELGGTMTYLGSWDHHPTDDERDAVDPPEVEDGR